MCPNVCNGKPGLQPKPVISYPTTKEITEKRRGSFVALHGVGSEVSRA